MRNSNAGGFAVLSYAVTEEVKNFTLEAYLFCPVTDSDKGPLSGLTLLIDPIKSRFYRFLCDFNKKEPSLNVAYVGRDTNHFPVYLRFWMGKKITEGIPKTSSWHSIKIVMREVSAQFFWNGMQLKDKVDISRISKGFVGVYANFVGGLGREETKVDSFILRTE